MVSNRALTKLAQDQAVTAHPRPPQTLLDRSARRQQAAVRRARRASGLPAETWRQRLAERLGGKARLLSLSLLWSAALAGGVAGGLWLTKPAPVTERRTQIAAEVRAADLTGVAQAERTARAERAAAVAPPRPLAPDEGVPAPPQAGSATADFGADLGGDLRAPDPAPAPPAERTLAVSPPAQVAPAGTAPPATRAALPARPDPPAWLANAVPTALDPERPMIAVVIDDLGLNRPATRETVALPGPLSLSFLAYAEELPAQAAAGRAAGHELLLHQPMEPLGAHNPGPEALLTGLGREENLARLTRALARAPGIVGINNHMGSRFTASAGDLEPVLVELKRRGLLFLDSRTTADSVGLALARKLGVPSTSRDVFLDHEAEAGRAYVEAQLARAEAIARAEGAAVAIGHPRPDTIAALRDWLPRLTARGLQLVPLSALVRARQGQQLAEAGVSRESRR